MSRLASARTRAARGGPHARRGRGLPLRGGGAARRVAARRMARALHRGRDLQRAVDRRAGRRAERHAVPDRRRRGAPALARRAAARQVDLVRESARAHAAPARQRAHPQDRGRARLGDGELRRAPHAHEPGRDLRRAATSTCSSAAATGFASSIAARSSTSSRCATWARSASSSEGRRLPCPHRGAPCLRREPRARSSPRSRRAAPRSCPSRSARDARPRGPQIGAPCRDRAGSTA